MPIHFAAARSAAHSPVARALARKALARAANDNGDAAQMRAAALGFDKVMQGALRHFAQHGMQAAKIAWQQAELAHSSGEIESYEWWLGICRTLDRTLAKRLEETVTIRSLLAASSGA